MKDALPPTTVVIPTLNEAAHVADLIDHFLPDASGDFVREILVADGGSRDGTAEIVERISRHDPRVRLVPNPKRLQSAGMNAALAVSDPISQVILRIDAHALYPADFARTVVAALAETGADSVVVRLRTVGGTCFQTAVAAAVNSRTGTGGALHRIGGASGFVEHGHHAAFRRGMLEAVGGYDEAFSANEDAELDLRISGQGGRIWFESAAEVTYYPRRTPAGLARQYWRYGRGRAQTFRKHRQPLRLRQLAPPIATLLLILSLVAASLLSTYFYILPAAYFTILIVIGVAMYCRSNEPCVLATPAALAILHLSWGGGFIYGLGLGKGSGILPVDRPSKGGT